MIRPSVFFLKKATNGNFAGHTKKHANIKTSRGKIEKCLVAANVLASIR